MLRMSTPTRVARSTPVLVSLLARSPNRLPEASKLPHDPSPPANCFVLVVLAVAPRSWPLDLHLPLSLCPKPAHSQPQCSRHHPLLNRLLLNLRLRRRLDLSPNLLQPQPLLTHGMLRPDQ